MDDAEQLPPVVLLRAALEGGEVLPAAAEYQHHRSVQMNIMWPQGTPYSHESTAPAAQHLYQHHKLSKRRWT